MQIPQIRETNKPQNQNNNKTEDPQTTKHPHPKI